MLDSWRVLHRISTIEWDDSDIVSGEGVSVCGVHGHFQMPGVLSRLGLKRCDHCCRRLGIPRGEGAPYNTKDVDWSGA